MNSYTNMKCSFNHIRFACTKLDTGKWFWYREDNYYLFGIDIFCFEFYLNFFLKYPLYVKYINLIYIKLFFLKKFSIFLLYLFYKIKFWLKDQNFVYKKVKKIFINNNDIWII